MTDQTVFFEDQNMKIALLLATGFEEIEALLPLDMLRRAGIDVQTVGIGGTAIQGAHGITVIADIEDVAANPDEYNAVILPGGMPGATNLDASDTCDAIIRAVCAKSGRLAAICAAPLVLGRKGLLKGKTATCYPGFEDELKGATVTSDSVVTDGNVTTARGMGVALEFAKELVRLFAGADKAIALSRAIMEKQHV